jgi:hypothetical protein
MTFTAARAKLFADMVQAHVDALRRGVPLSSAYDVEHVQVYGTPSEGRILVAVDSTDGSMAEYAVEYDVPLPNLTERELVAMFLGTDANS